MRYVVANILVLMAVPEDQDEGDVVSEWFRARSDSITGKEGGLITWELVAPYDNAIRFVKVSPDMANDYDLQLASLFTRE